MTFRLLLSDGPQFSGFSAWNCTMTSKGAPFLHWLSAPQRLSAYLLFDATDLNVQHRNWTIQLRKTSKQETYSIVGEKFLSPTQKKNCPLSQFNRRKKSIIRIFSYAWEFYGIWLNPEKCFTYHFLHWILLNPQILLGLAYSYSEQGDSILPKKLGYKKLCQFNQ